MHAAIILRNPTCRWREMLPVSPAPAEAFRYKYFRKDLSRHFLEW
jgi:hypothetical protein